MRISDWSSDVCSSDLLERHAPWRGVAVLADQRAGEIVRAPCAPRQAPGLRRLGQPIAHRRCVAHGPRGPGLCEVHAAVPVTAPLFVTGTVKPFLSRSDTRRVGTECVSKCNYRGVPSL